MRPERRPTPGSPHGPFAACLLVLFLAGACGENPPTSPVPNARPQLTLTASPLPGDSVSYVVLFRWFASDEDGAVTRVTYAIDPPPDGDTLWVATTQHEVTIPFPSTAPGSQASTSPHVFVIKAWDNDGACSEPVFRGFTSYTVAPQSRITAPQPNPTGTLLTLNSLTIEWTGIDYDGVNGTEPTEYRYALVPLQTIRAELGIPYASPSASDVQRYFEGFAPGFETWKRASPESTSVTYENLTVGPQLYFAVVAFDEAGAYESRFILGGNVLRFQPTVSLPLPRLAVWTSFFRYEQTVGSNELSERLVQRIDFVAGRSLDFQWSAVPWTGTELTGYRWILDPLNGDLSDETPRQNDSETYRWSDWALSETEATIGPFAANPGGEPPRHNLYVEVRDNGNRTSIVAVEVRVLTLEADRPLLVFDDYRANADRIYAGDPDHPLNYQPYGNFPTEAVLDTLLFAVGGVPYQRRPAGTMSVPGMFAGFEYDTLDYRFTLDEGISLEVLLHYRAVVIFTGLQDATRNDLKYTGGIPMSAIRSLCRSGTLNTLALYIQGGGQVWLFGDGMLLAMIRGALGSTRNPPLVPPAGTFLYEYLKAQSQLYDPERRGDDYWVGATPNLPQFATPGRTWPPATWQGSRGPADDPRVGPAAARNLQRWDGLPMLTMTADFLDWPSPFPSNVREIIFVARPNEILEDLDPGPDFDWQPTLDTLYLYRAATYRNEPHLGGQPTSDGKPAMLAYHGGPGGLVVWSNLPLWFMERQQLQQLADVVLRNMGITRQANRAEWTGPGSAHRFLGEAVVP